MKRYTTFLDCAEQHDNGRFYIAREVSALLAAVAEEVRKIELSGWENCECAICADNRDAHKRALALLEAK